MNSSTAQQIHAALPHRSPMLLVDSIEHQDENQIVCRKTFRPDEFFFQGHYPDFPLVPGVILCESAAQAGAILLSGLIDDANGVPVLTKMDNVRFKRMVRPGDTIEMEVKLDDQISNAWYLSARVTCEGQLALRLSFVCTVTEALDRG